MRNSKGHVYIIAEVGVNHNGDPKNAFKLMDLAAEAGADAVKFQMFVPNLLCSARYRRAEIETLNKYVVSFEQMKIFRDYAAKNGLGYIVTPFDFQSLDDVLRIEPDAIKIASGELSHMPFLKKISMTGMPVILSTGASSLADVYRAAAVLIGGSIESLALLHCTSTYPAPDDCLNLSAITTLKNAFPECTVGYSDHSLGSTASSIAVALGAKIIEKHITLDHGMEGPDHTASADGQEFVGMVSVIRKAEIMMGTGEKRPQSCEGVIGRSIVAGRDMRKGEMIQPGDLDIKRPGVGVKPYYLDCFTGKTLTKDIAYDELLTPEHVVGDY